MNILKTASSSKWAGKTWSVLGDSITYGVNTTLSYHQYIAIKTGCSVLNYGVSGTGWRTGSGFGGGNAFYQRVSSISTVSDLVTVFGGVNDWAEVGALMNLGAMGDTATTSLYGAIDNTLSALVTNFPTKTIAVFTPLQRQSAYYNLGHQTTSPKWAATTAQIVNNIIVPITANGHVYKCTVAGTTGAVEPTWVLTAGGTVVDGTVTWTEIGSDTSTVSLQQISTAITQVANKYNIPVLDLYNNANSYVWNATYRTNFMPDGLHPNDAGHKLIADKILSFLNSL